MSARINFRFRISDFRFNAMAWCAMGCVIGSISVAGGCQKDTAPSAGMGDPYPAPLNDPQISVVSPELRKWLVFQPAIITNVGQRPITIEVPVRNTTYNKYLIEFRMIFIDANGRELNPIMGWEFASLDPKQVVRLKRSAMTTEAVNYRMEVRWSR